MFTTTDTYSSASANLDAFVSAQFTVEAGANKLKRPVAGGAVQAGALRSVNGTNSTTSVGAPSVSASASASVSLSASASASASSN
jgi:hypothetical protein